MGSIVYGDASQPHIPTSISDAMGATWQIAHNPFGQITAITPPANSPLAPASVTYDETFGPNRGYPTLATDGNGDWVTFDAYDGLGDLLQVSTYPVHGNPAVKNTTTFTYGHSTGASRSNSDGTRSWRSPSSIQPRLQIYCISST